MTSEKLGDVDHRWQMGGVRDATDTNGSGRILDLIDSVEVLGGYQKDSVANRGKARDAAYECSVSMSFSEQLQCHPRTPRYRAVFDLVRSRSRSNLNHDCK